MKRYPSHFTPHGTRADYPFPRSRLLTQVWTASSSTICSLKVTQKSQADVDGLFQSDYIYQQFHVPLDNPCIGIATVFTTKADTTDHEPLRNLSGNIHEGLELEERCLRLPHALVARFQKFGWIINLSPGRRGKKSLPKTPHIELWSKIALRHDNKSIELGIEIIAPESIPFRREYCCGFGVDED